MSMLVVQSIGASIAASYKASASATQMMHTYADIVLNSFLFIYSSLLIVYFIYLHASTQKKKPLQFMSQIITKTVKITSFARKTYIVHVAYYLFAAVR